MLKVNTSKDKTSKVLTNTIVIDQAKTNKNLQSYIQKATRRYERCHTK